MSSKSTRPRALIRRVRAIVLMPLLVAATACGSDSERPTRPPITRPLDASAFRDHACDLLPAADATMLGYPAPGSDDKRYREGAQAGDVPRVYTCDRLPPKSRWLVIELYLNEDRLAVEYFGSKLGTMTATNEPIFDAITIADQPAAVLGRSRKQPELSQDPCEVVVALTDTQSVTISAGTRQPDRPKDNTGGRSCQLAIDVADAIVRNLVKQS
jgi:hypothetical protein